MERNGNHVNRSLTAFVNDLQAKGRYTFTQAEAAEVIKMRFWEDNQNDEL